MSDQTFQESTNKRKQISEKARLQRSENMKKAREAKLNKLKTKEPVEQPTPPAQTILKEEPKPPAQIMRHVEEKEEYVKPEELNDFFFMSNVPKEKNKKEKLEFKKKTLNILDELNKKIEEQNKFIQEMKIRKQVKAELRTSQTQNNQPLLIPLNSQKNEFDPRELMRRQMFGS